MNVNQPIFTNSAKLTSLVNAYFKYIEGEFHLEDKPGKTANSLVESIKVFNREAEPPTIAGLTFFLGFNSRQEFDEYEANGEFANILKRARLRIESEYEKKLHFQSSAGAMFALKSMGWNERADDKAAPADMPRSIIIQIIDSNIKSAGNEQDVIL